MTFEGFGVVVVSVIAELVFGDVEDINDDIDNDDVVAIDCDTENGDTVNGIVVDIVEDVGAILETSSTDTLQMLLSSTSREVNKKTDL